MHNHSHTPSLEAAPRTQGSVIRWATWYDALVNVLTVGRARALREQAVSLGQLAAGESVLDVGCGTGEVALRARKQVGAEGRVAGTDASPEMINVARSKALDAHLQVDYRVGLVEALPYPDRSFDVVFSSLMMHHLPPQVKRAGLREIYRVLKPQGRLVIVDFERPRGAWSTVMLVVTMHGGLKQGVQDLAPLLQEFHFTQVETGDLKLPMMGFVRARRESS